MALRGRVFHSGEGSAPPLGPRGGCRPVERPERGRLLRRTIGPVSKTRSRGVRPRGGSPARAAASARRRAPARGRRPAIFFRMMTVAIFEIAVILMCRRAVTAARGLRRPAWSGRRKAPVRGMSPRRGRGARRPRTASNRPAREAMARCVPMRSRPPPSRGQPHRLREIRRTVKTLARAPSLIPHPGRSRSRGIGRRGIARDRLER